MSQGNFGRHESLSIGGFFVSSESVRYHHGAGESLRTWSSLNFKFRKLQGTFCLYTKILGDLFIKHNILVLKCG